MTCRFLHFVRLMPVMLAINPALAKDATSLKPPGSTTPMVHVTLDTGWTSPTMGDGPATLRHGYCREQGDPRIPSVPMLGSCLGSSGQLLLNPCEVPGPQPAVNPPFPSVGATQLCPADAGIALVSTAPVGTKVAVTLEVSCRAAPPSDPLDAELALGPVELRIDLQSQAASVLALDWMPLIPPLDSTLTTLAPFTLLLEPGSYFVQATIVRVPAGQAPSSLPGLLLAGETENYDLVVGPSGKETGPLAELTPHAPWTGPQAATKRHAGPVQPRRKWLPNGLGR